jgi:hypothetical protein
LVNAVIHHMVVLNPAKRIFIIEDTGEIQCTADNCVQHHTSLEVPMTAPPRTTLRMRPDRILVGEVRGAEALDLLPGTPATKAARHPQTNGMVERFNGRISELIRQTHFASAAELEATLQNYWKLYNHHIPQRAIDGKAE